jgi:hypothetical protein
VVVVVLDEVVVSVEGVAVTVFVTVLVTVLVTVGPGIVTVCVGPGIVVVTAGFASASIFVSRASKRHFWYACNPAMLFPLNAQVVTAAQAVGVATARRTTIAVIQAARRLIVYLRAVLSIE